MSAGDQGAQSTAGAAVSALSIPPERLRATFSEIPADVPELDGIAGQGRAREAVEFGLAMRAAGYNLVVSGQRSSGRNRLVRESIEVVARTKPVPPDLVYLFNFQDPRRPRIVRLAPGMGMRLQAGLGSVVEACRGALPAAFASEAYETGLQRAMAPISGEREKVLDTLGRVAHSLAYIVNATPMGWIRAPIGPNGQPLTTEEFASLPEPQQRDIEARGEKVEAAVAEATHELRRLEAAAKQRVREFDGEVMRGVLGPILDDLHRAFDGAGLEAHIRAIETDIANNLDTYKQVGTAPAEALPQPMLAQVAEQREALLQRYAANVFVSHDGSAAGAPVVDERHASYFDLFGRIEFENRFGALITDFTRIRPGAIHLANGGYLILQAEELFADPRSWPKLKRALKTGEIRFDDISEGFLLPVANLAPEGIPLDVKVALVGTPGLFAILDMVDQDFSELFRVRAEFEPDTQVNEEAIGVYHSFVDATVKSCGLHPIDRGGLIELLHFGSRLAGRQDRLSTQLGLVALLCQEADQIATARGASMIEAADVQGAVTARDRRSSLVPDRIRRMIAEGTLHIETQGSRIGQINGLAVFSIGSREFGAPTRITCRTGVGRRGVVDIERETERSGAIHTKGVLVLDGFLNGTFGRSHPLAFTASLTFEQSYDEVEGDSASSAELYAILTSLAGVAVRQDIAVTGSIDQFGNVQAVGGVTEKVEGFFDVCKEIGLTGGQGVIIPETNMVDLTLRPDVVAAVSAGQFHLWKVRRVEEGLELLTGIPAGTPDWSGRYPESTLFSMVTAALRRMRLGAVSESEIDAMAIRAAGGAAP